MKSLRKMLTLLVALCLAFGLVACGGASSSTPPASGASSGGSAGGATGDEVTVTFALWDEVQFPVFEEICAKFTEENPGIVVDLQLTPWDQYWTKLDAAAGAGKAADVFWMNIFFPKYVEGEILEPLNPYFEKDGLDKAAWTPAMMDLYSQDGEQYGMPKGMDVVVVAYNKGIFDKYEVEYPQEGWTWADMEAIGAELRDKIEAAGGKEYPLLMELDSQPSYLQFMLQDGVQIYSDDGTSNGYGTPEAAKSFHDILRLMDEKIMPSFTTLSDTKGTDLFLSEMGAMLYVGSWKSSVLDGASFASNIGLVTMPKRSVSNVCALGGISFAMNARGENKDAAWELIKYLGGYESGKMQAEARIEIPAYIDAQEFYIPAFQNIDPTAFITQSESSTSYPVHPKMAGWMGIETEYTTDIFSGTVTPEAGLKAFSDEVTAMENE